MCVVCTKSQLFINCALLLDCFGMIFMVVTSSSTATTLILTLLFVVLRSLEVWIVIMFLDLVNNS